MDKIFISLLGFVVLGCFAGAFVGFGTGTGSYIAMAVSVALVPMLISFVLMCASGSPADAGESAPRDTASV